MFRIYLGNKQWIESAIDDKHGVIVGWKSTADKDRAASTSRESAVIALRMLRNLGASCWLVAA